MQGLTRLRALVIGCGRVGSGYDESRGDDSPLSHAGAYRAHPRTELVGGVDIDALARRRFEARWSVPTWETVEEAIEAATPDVVSVCTLPADRREILASLHGVRAAWIEKPMALTSGEAVQFERLLADKGIMVQVNFHRRFDPGHRTVAAQLREDGSAVVHADCRHSGPLLTYGIHGLDLFRWFLGECEQVDVAGGHERPIVLLRTAAGGTACFARITGRATDLFEWDMHTFDRRYTFVALGEELAIREPERSTLYPTALRYGYGVPSSTAGLRPAMLGGVSSLVDAVHGTAEPLCSAQDGIASLRLLEAIELAVEQQSPVVMHLAA